MTGGERDAPALRFSVQTTSEIDRVGLRSVSGYANAVNQQSGVRGDEMFEGGSIPACGTPAVRVAIIDDHELIVAALAAALRAEGCDVDVPSLGEALPAWSLETAPHVALLDLDLGAHGSGEDLLPALIASGCKVLVVSGTSNESVIGRCLWRGASGWLQKSASLDQLLAAILALAAGGEVLSGSERDRLMRVWRERREVESAALAPFLRLSPRERAVLGLLMEGRSVDRIARTSFVSSGTVRTQVRAILTKLGVNSQLEAVAMAKRAGWVPGPA
jgi:two-component system, NarL family, nitrate/nitrite response regulator NarL